MRSGARQARLESSMTPLRYHSWGSCRDALSLISASVAILSQPGIYLSLVEVFDLHINVRLALSLGIKYIAVTAYGVNTMICVFVFIDFAIPCQSVPNSASRRGKLVC
ncbi:hypothetical protein DL95DRAFT_63109 [Leptodontidium sp. 2 PMI_412]|nr:hypothetical protein DL95DRAFT_63109 [Leptodontidium sp. 2 PMI_412]